MFRSRNHQAVLPLLFINNNPDYIEIRVNIHEVKGTTFGFNNLFTGFVLGGGEISWRDSGF